MAVCSKCGTVQSCGCSLNSEGVCGSCNSARRQQRQNNSIASKLIDSLDKPGCEFTSTHLDVWEAKLDCVIKRGMQNVSGISDIIYANHKEVIRRAREEGELSGNYCKYYHALVVIQSLMPIIQKKAGC